MSRNQTSASSPQDVVMHIHHTETLTALIDLSAFNPAVGRSVRDLTISIAAGTGDAVLVALAIRRALRMTPNVETLILDVAFPLPDYILGGITFHGLKNFSSNLAHSVLHLFLHRHPFLVSLSLRNGECNSCPIRGVGFSNLLILQSSSRCFRTGIAYGRIPAPGDRLALVPISALPSRSLPVLRLETLVLDFYPDEHSLLADIASAAPNVRKLKLNERPHPQHRAQTSRRAWKDLPAWHRELLRMPLLEEFCLRTFAKVGGTGRSEANVVCGWVQGCTRPAHPHPSLFRIAVIQQHAEIGQRLSHWFMAGRGEWDCISATMVGPTHHFAI